MEDKSLKICAVIICYYPVHEVLVNLQKNLHSQLTKIVLVNNSPPETLSISVGAAVHIIQNSGNFGVATALNQGIRYAMEQGFGYVLLLDQDSSPIADMCVSLMSALKHVRQQNQAVAAVGPLQIDKHLNQHTSFVKFALRKNQHFYCADRHSIWPCDFLITSGSLIPVSVFTVVGLMDEGVFIDNVDMEWCFRAAFYGYQFFGVCAAQMEHCIGDDYRQIGRLTIKIHNPVRQYYMMRNRIYLYRKNYVPTAWKCRDAIRLPGKLFFFSTLVKPRWQNLKLMWKGLWHGLTGRMGAL